MAKVKIKTIRQPKKRPVVHDWQVGVLASYPRWTLHQLYSGAGVGGVQLSNTMSTGPCQFWLRLAPRLILLCTHPGTTLAKHLFPCTLLQLFYWFLCFWTPWSPLYIHPLNHPWNHFPSPKSDLVPPILKVLYYLAVAVMCRTESSVTWSFINPVELQPVFSDFHPDSLGSF